MYIQSQKVKCTICTKKLHSICEIFLSKSVDQIARLGVRYNQFKGTSYLDGVNTRRTKPTTLFQKENKKMKMERTWKNVELNQNDANELKDFLNDYGILFESSECYDKIHFEIFVGAYETEAINDFLDELDKMNEFNRMYV